HFGTDVIAVRNQRSLGDRRRRISRGHRCRSSGFFAVVTAASGRAEAQTGDCEQNGGQFLVLKHEFKVTEEAVGSDNLPRIGAAKFGLRRYPYGLPAAG